MAKREIKSYVEDVLSPLLNQNCLELYHIEFTKEGKDWFLRIFIDRKNAEKDEYVSTDDCELVSRYLSDCLDRDDPIEQNYYLEVSSPGMDRQLYEEKDFVRFAGEPVEVKTYKAINGKKITEGILCGIFDENVIIKDESGNEMVFPLNQIVKVNLAVVF